MTSGTEDLVEVAALREALTTAARDVLDERKRQVQQGWTPDHDNLYVDGEMACAAFCYGIYGTVWERKLIAPIIALWPWNVRWWKPTNRRRDLIKAGALILAEIERLDRAAARDPEP